MIKIARDWATPLTMGAFTLMAITGVLLFFRLDVGLNKVAHEWLGWMMIAAVATHAAANWTGLRRYLSAGGKSRAILIAALAALALTFVPVPGRQGRAAVGAGAAGAQPGAAQERGLSSRQVARASENRTAQCGPGGTK
jgi:hypothetical protein